MDEFNAPVRDHLIGADGGLEQLASAALDPLFWPAERLGAASAWWLHVPFAQWIVAATAPRTLVELGTHAGVSYSAFCQAVLRSRLGTRCHAVDTWRGDPHAGEYGEEVFEELRAFHDERYARFSTLLRCTFDEARDQIDDGSIDFLHIDGLHTYDAVRHDFKSWAPKLSDRSVVLFHDTNEHHDDFGVWRLWSELRERYPSFEFFHGHGLGVLAVGARVPPAVAALCALDDIATATVRERFYSLGERWLRDTSERELSRELERRSAAAEAAGAEAMARAESDVAALRQNLLARESELTASRRAASATTARLTADLRKLRADYDHVVGSLSWRATEPFRRIFLRHPRALPALKKLGRLATWVVTFRYSKIRRAFRPRVQISREERIVAGSGLFDQDFYLENNPDAASANRTPLWHYLVHGWLEGRRPHPLFDGDWYLRQYPEVARSGTNPLVHFVEVGAAQYLNPNPFFDTKWYVRMNPDVISSGLNPLQHFVTIGTARHADPSPAFHAAFYLDQNPDVAAAGLNPLAHYLLRGLAEGRWPRMPAPDFASSRPVAAARIECRKQPAVQTETALFVTHSPDGRLKPHVRGYLEALARESIGVILIVATEDNFVGDEPWLYELVDGLFIRANEGFDFAAWAHVLRLHREIYRAEILYLLNDSVIGPLNSALFHAAIERLRQMPADLIGMLDSHERTWHIQSYFLALKQTALRSYAWQEFVLGIVSFTDKDDVINNYEVRLAPLLAAAGLTTSPLFAAKSNRNGAVFHWRELLAEGFPFMKIMAIRDEIPGSDMSGWREEVSKLGYDVTIVDKLLTGDTIGIGQDREHCPVPARHSVPAAPRRPPRVAFIGPWNYDNGLGVGARGHLSALMRTGDETNILPIVKPFHIHHRIAPSAPCCDFVGPADVAVVEVNAEGWDALLTQTQWDVIRGAAMRIGGFIRELRKLPARFGGRLREVDAIWTPTDYCAEIFRSVTEVPVHVVHFAVAAREHRQGWRDAGETKRSLGLAENSKVILFAFDASSYIARKNPFALVAAFQETGLAAAGWSLILKTKLSRDDRRGAEALRAKVAGCEGALLIDRPMSGDAMTDLMAAADIYASPHSSEGFGLTIAEAMEMGKIVVATDYGGSRDFLDPETGFPVRWSPWRLARDEGPYGEGTIWARVDESHLAESLLAAASLSEEDRQRLGERARERIHEILSPEAVAEEMRTSISSLMESGRAL